ncbi:MULTISPECIES: DUF2059 domain-containing protein [unclassified Moraxella]|uniref:DUF2059 domain-containing protein n=1 Tax=unclassified Moraxella TaxID=2685852 RepID=UPI00359ECB05
MTLKKGIITAYLLAGLIFGTYAIAQTPSDTSLDQLMQVTHAEQVLKDSMKLGFTSSLTQSALLGPGFRHLPDDKKAQLEILFNEFGETVWQDIDDTIELFEKTKQIYLQVAKKHHTQQEVDAMINFYQSPIGQDIVVKENMIMNEVSNKAIDIISKDAKFLQKVEEATKKHLPAFEDKVKELLK